MVNCIIKSDNHSDDQIHIQSGQTYSIPVCGYHDVRYSGTQAIFTAARSVAEIESQWVVWSIARDTNEVTAEIKKSALAARRAYNKLTGKEYGFSRVNDADPNVRRALGYSAFPQIHIPIS